MFPEYGYSPTILSISFQLSGLLEHALSELGGVKDIEKDLSNLKKSLTEVSLYKLFL